MGNSETVTAEMSFRWFLVLCASLFVMGFGMGSCVASNDNDLAWELRHLRRDLEEVCGHE